MTVAPPALLAVRQLLLAYLDLTPGRTVDSDLDPAEVGIVGDTAHRGGYHVGSDRVTTNDYSVVESPRDRQGLSLYASALDVGWFRVTVRGQVHDLRTFSTWLVTQCRANTPDTADIREVIYSTDGLSVRRWDRLGRRSTGDASHLRHTHISYFRDATLVNRPQAGVYRRYLAAIGLMPGPTEPPKKWKGRDMFLIKKIDNPTVYLSWGAGRATLVDARLQLLPLQEAGMPLISVQTDAQLDTIGGPLRTTTRTVA